MNSDVVSTLHMVHKFEANVMNKLPENAVTSTPCRKFMAPCGKSPLWHTQPVSAETNE
eukprot:CAMPEP_0174710354 /NCGR_PEP_ID=MMETSP1094-20130205/12015_1 /TAXON_ID=156173 /ORGANISM="Chrysochromulina brevifilum, Strain UTEX LB 985" /LENGTH=57 /DNA_ID=CAMNT_0015909151 /DNA_START=335 /DNA_END=508 /DNA_ORIENTATION=-